ncbi:MAG: geranylgeranylglycerol-phosphate geranylgeranyltransferase [Bacteroidales bacterium]
MKAFLKLIRWQNLLIIALTMVLMRYAVISPILGKIGVKLYNIAGNQSVMTLIFPWYDFVILVLSTVLITAAGYVINDYFDIKTDLINRGSVLVGTSIPRRKAMMLHNVLNIAGVLAGFYVSWKVGYLWLGIFFILVSGLLYFYSASYKRQFLIGNLIVALLTAMVPMMVVLFETPALYQYYAVNSVALPKLGILFYWVGGFALFAFLTTLAREIIKDIEDFEGDVAYGRNTVPVVLGIITTKVIAVCLVAITIILLFVIWYFFVNDLITLIYVSAAIALPLSYVIYLTLSGKTKLQLHKASNVMKIAMLTGILYSVVAWAIITYKLLY